MEQLVLDMGLAPRPTLANFLADGNRDALAHLALWAHNHQRSAAELAEALGITEAHAQAVYQDIEAKRRATAYLHARPALVDAVLEVQA